MQKFCLPIIGKTLVIWRNLAAREAGKYSILVGLLSNILILKMKKINIEKQF